MSKWKQGTKMACIAKRLLKETGVETTGVSMHVQDARPTKVHIYIRNDQQEEMTEKLEEFAGKLKEEADKMKVQLIEVYYTGLPYVSQSVVAVKFRKNKKEDQQQGEEKKESATKITVETTGEKETTWKDIKAAAAAGKAKELLKVGDRIPFKTKRGKEGAVLVAHISEDKVYLVMDDAHERYCMKEELKEGKVLSWSESDMREHLKECVLPDLPDDMEAAISTRMIEQRIGGEKVFTEDKLWLLSYTELFGDVGDDNYDTDGETEFRFEIFKDEKSRVRQFEGETDWWWTRTPVSGSSTYFRYVTTAGYAYSNYAAYAGSVCFGFCVG